MYGIFMECLVILKLYTGLRLLAVVYLLGLLYLLVTEKEKRIRALTVYTPLVILALFLCPLFRKYFVGAGLDGETYYRVLWLLPMGVTIAYAGCKLFALHKRVGLVMMAAAVIFSGAYVYASPNITKAENAYHIPEVVVKICDYLKEQEGKGYIKTVVPKELAHFVRQYNTDIKMPYGRNMLVPRWDYYHEVYAAMEETEVLDAEALVKATRNYECNYIVLHESREWDEDPAGYQLVLVQKIDGYLIYQDLVAARRIEEIYGKYLDGGQ